MLSLRFGGGVDFLKRINEYILSDKARGGGGGVRRVRREARGERSLSARGTAINRERGEGF